MKPNGFGIHPACTDEFVAWCADVIDREARPMSDPYPDPDVAPIVARWSLVVAAALVGLVLDLYRNDVKHWRR